jgi:hypothetical protein
MPANGARGVSPMTTYTVSRRFATVAGASAAQVEARLMRKNLRIVCLFSALGMTLTCIVLFLDKSNEVAHALALAG